MQPNQPQGMPPQNSGNSQYDFIMNHGQQPNKKMQNYGSGGGSMKQRIIFAGAGAFALIIVGIIAFSLLAGSGDDSQLDLISAAKSQSLAIHVADVGVQKAKTNEAKNLAITTRATLKSEQTALSAAIKKQGIKVTPAEITVLKDATTDAALTAAEQNNQFDTKFVEVMKLTLTSYQQKLKKASDTTTSKSMKTLLADQYGNVNKLVAAQKTTEQP